MTVLQQTTGLKGARDALVAARDHLLASQAPEGWWKGELETNVTMEAEDLLLRYFLGVLTPEVLDTTARWIRHKQRDDGTWANFFGGPGELSTTVESYVALRLAGDAADDAHMAAARAFILDNGGIEQTRAFTRMWLAVVGQWSWEELPAVPPEVVFLPAWFPLNVYDFACWARQTLVAIAVVAAHRPQRPLPFTVDELKTGRAPAPLTTRAALTTSSGRFRLLDRVLHRYEAMAADRGPVRRVRRTALEHAERWIIQRQEADGSWGGIQPPWVYSLLALHVQGYAIDHPVMAAGLHGLERFTVHENGMRRLEACQSPVWDTALAVIALRDAGVASDAPAIVRAADWLVAEEVAVAGDWQVRRPSLAPGGWAFEFDNDFYPDVDDTAEVVLALLRSGSSDSIRLDAAVERALHWTVGMQSRDGGWGAFDADNTSPLPALLPFCDFGEVTDPPSADVTAHVVEMLAAHGGMSHRVVDRGVAWLLANQEEDGSWFGRWGANYVYGTGAVVPALVATAMSPRHPAIARAVVWLEQHQNGDGGWGEDMRSYDDPTLAGQGASTASQTAWALLALLAAGREETPAVERGIGFLVTTQTADGTWDEPWYTGTGFPGDFLINYHLYRHVFPLTALGRYLEAVT
jgi:squalene-hopene/tetraprenyl-beta-curcumene cyclase